MNQYPPVVLEREYAASIDRVFDAWTTAESLSRWFRGSPESHVRHATVDLQVGGAYRIEVQGKEDVYVVLGHYLTIERPYRLEFTWKWEEGTLEPGETLVQVELTPVGERTRLRLTHSKFTTDQSAQAHDKGWLAVLTTLGTFVEEEKL